MAAPFEGSLSEQVYQYVQQRLLAGTLCAGQAISEQAIADELGFSRTPVREAIGRLEAEGLVIRSARVGTLVRAPDHRDLRELYQLREALEGMAARSGAPHLPDSEVEMLARSCEAISLVAVQMDEVGADYLQGAALRRYLDADIAFHMVIVRGLNNRRCMKTITEYRVVQRIFEYHRVVHTPRLVKQAQQQHREILNAIRMRDAAAAEQAMQHHIRCSRDHALAAFDPSEIAGRDDAERLELPVDLMQHFAAV